MGFLLVRVQGIAQGQTFVFSDPANLYSTLIPDNWVYQAHHSTPQLTVFYGEGDFELLYFESLGTTSDVSVKQLAERSLELYTLPGGLEEFQLDKPLQAAIVADQWGLSCSYSYVDWRGNALREYRVFLLLPGNQGFSIAVSCEQSSITDASFLEDILKHWRWLF
jgi:hypothetical protein